MLHILLFILKLIGILLLILLGLIVVTICAVLFIPLRYYVTGSCKGKLETLDACIQFSVFFRLLRGKIVYKEQNLKWEIYIAWKRLLGSEPAEQLKEKTEEFAEEADNAALPEESEAEKSLDNPAVEMEETEEDFDSPVIEPTETEEAFDSPAIEMTEIKEAEPPAKKEKQDKTEEKKITDKIAALFEKIKCTIEKICDKIKLLYEKAELVQEFLTDEVHLDAFKRVMKGGKTLLYRLRPKKAGGEIAFGFSDPSWTGKLLAVLSMIHAYLGESVLFYPDFQQKKLEGSLYVKGRVRTFPFAAYAVRLLLAKSIRTTIHDIRNFHF